MTTAQAAIRLKVEADQVAWLRRNGKLKGRKVWRTITRIHRGKTHRSRRLMWDISA